jgi:hypothetical protein
MCVLGRKTTEEKGAKGYAGQAERREEVGCAVVKKQATGVKRKARKKEMGWEERAQRGIKFYFSKENYFILQI